MKPVRTWILVADGGRARFLENDGPGKGLTTAGVKPLTHDLKATREMGTDKPGRLHDAGFAQRSAVEVPDWHRFEKERFAHEVAQVLDRHRKQHDFDRLILIAPAKTLGDLRKALDSNCKDLVVAEIDKDLTHHDDKAIAGQLEDVLAV